MAEDQAREAVILEGEHDLRRRQPFAARAFAHTALGAGWREIAPRVPVGSLRRISLCQMRRLASGRGGGWPVPGACSNRAGAPGRVVSQHNRTQQSQPDDRPAPVPRKW